MEDNTALVVIDTQRGMFETPGVPPVPDGGRLLKKVEGLVRSAREAGATVIHVRHAGGPADGEPTVDKETPDSFLRTTLENELGSGGIGRLVLAGMQTEYCVATTCRRAETLTAAQIVAHHNEVMGNGFAEVVSSGEISFGEGAKA